MAPKKTKQVMSIGDFLNDQSLGSWADEMETQPMPSAPSGGGFGGERRAFSTASSFGGGGGEKFGDAGFARTFRDELPLPTRPPYTAHLGNLSFETTEGDVQDFLTGCEVTSVRLVEDKLDHRPKGFGYVEFGSVEGLKKALTLSETQFQGRNIRISIAEPQKDRGEGREISDWSRKGPLPDLPGQGMRRTSERTGSFRGGYEAASDAGSERGGRRPMFEGDGKSRDFSNWERRGPLSPPPQSADGPRQGGRGPPSRGPGQFEERHASPSWGEGQNREARSSDAGSRPPRPERVPTAADNDSQWRSKMRPDAPSPAPTPDASTPSSPSAPSAPAARPRLNLAKRTVSEAQPSDAKPGAAGGSSIFGGAKPIDTRAKEAEIEKRHQESVKAKQEADAKAREEKKAREAARSERAVAAPAAEMEAAADAPRENGSSKPIDRKQSSAGSPPPPAQKYEILRRMDDVNEPEGGDHDGVDASANGEIVQDKETKPQEITREVPAGGSGSSWRQAPEATEDTATELEDDGFTVVAQKARKGRNGASRALAS